MADYYDLVVGNSGNQEKLPQAEPVSFGNRLLAAFKSSDTGVENYLKSQYGPNKVARDENNNIIVATGKDSFLKIDPEGVNIGPALEEQFGKNRVIKNKNGTFTIAPSSGYAPFDPKGFDIGDIADAAPVATALGASALATAATAGASIPITALALAAAGGGSEAINQLAGKVLPGDEDLSTFERAARIGVGAIAEPLGTAAVKGVTTAAKLAKGTIAETGARAISKLSGVTKAAEEAATPIEQTLGAPLSVGEKGQGKLALAVEGFFRRNPFTQGIVAEADQKKLEGLTTFADKAVKELGTGKSEESGKAAIGAFKGVLENLDSIRRISAAKEFGHVTQLAGTDKIFPIRNTIKAIDDLAAEYESDLGDTQATKTVEYLLKKKDELTKQQQSGPLLSSRSFQNALSRWGKAAYDPRGIIEGVTDRSIERRVAAKVFDALKSDLDNAAAGTGLKQDAAQALKQARDNYSSISQTIKDVTDNPLADYIDRPDVLADKLSKNSISDEKVSNIFKFLDKNSPVSANELRSGVLAEVLQRSKNTIESRVGNVINPAALFKEDFVTNGKLGLVFAGDTEAKAAYENLIGASKVMARKYGEGSPTQPLLAIADLINKASPIIPAALGAGAYGRSGETSDVTGPLLATAAAAFSSRALARAMTNPAVARSYATVMKAAVTPELFKGGVKSKVIKQAIVDIAGFQQRESLKDRVSQSGGENAKLSAP